MNWIILDMTQSYVVVCFKVTASSSNVIHFSDLGVC